MRDLLLAGHAPARIARDLGVSVWTVRAHIQAVYRRTGVNGLDELMARFINGRVEGK